MKLASYLHARRASYGKVQGDVVHDLGAVSGAPADLMRLLALGDEGRIWIDASLGAAPTIALDAVHLQAPIPAPRKFLGLGGNYESHLAEARKINLERPKGQVWLNKQVSCIYGPYDPVHLPRVSRLFDYEGELRRTRWASPSIRTGPSARGSSRGTNCRTRTCCACAPGSTANFARTATRPR